MNQVKFEHKQVISTLRNCGLITSQAEKSIYGQIIKMDSESAEQYLKKIIKNSKNKTSIK